MPRAKTPRNGTPSSKQVISMSEGTRKKVGATTPTPDLEEQIRVRAYEIWEENGRLEGTEEDDWKQAEREIHARNDQQFA